MLTRGGAPDMMAFAVTRVNLEDVNAELDASAAKKHITPEQAATAKRQLSQVKVLDRYDAPGSVDLFSVAKSFRTGGTVALTNHGPYQVDPVLTRRNETAAGIAFGHLAPLAKKIHERLQQPDCQDTGSGQ